MGDQQEREIPEAEIWKPELKPRVYYMNLPGKFIAGTVYDPIEKEVIINASCMLTETISGKTFDTKTDNFGDFWFEDSKEGEFTLQIIKGSKVESFAGLNTTERDINLGIYLCLRKYITDCLMIGNHQLLKRGRSG